MESGLQTVWATVKYLRLFFGLDDEWNRIGDELAILRRGVFRHDLRHTIDRESSLSLSATWNETVNNLRLVNLKSVA